MKRAERSARQADHARGRPEADPHRATGAVVGVEAGVEGRGSPCRHGPGEKIANDDLGDRSGPRKNSSVTLERRPASASSGGPLSVSVVVSPADSSAGSRSSRPRTSDCAPVVSTKLDEAGAAFPPATGVFARPDGTGASDSAASDVGLNGSVGAGAPWIGIGPRGIGTLMGPEEPGARGRHRARGGRFGDRDPNGVSGGLRRLRAPSR